MADRTSINGFEPGVDGIRFNRAWTREAIEANEVRGHLKEAIDEALALLEPEFTGALEICGVRQTLKDRVAGHLPVGSGAGGGMVFVILDYFYGHFPISFRRAKSTFQSDPVTGRKDHPWHTYFKQRTRDSVKSLAATFLAWTGVLQTIPERWLPGKMVLAPIYRELEHLGLFEYFELDLDLKLPCPGGAGWLSHNTLCYWAQMKRSLNTGAPLPICLVGHSKNPFPKYQVIAFDYKEHHEDTGLMQVFDPANPDLPKTIFINLSNGNLTAGEGFDDRSIDPLSGFFIPDYRPRTPPITFFERMLRYFNFW